jgi:hypothetical protein
MKNSTKSKVGNVLLKIVGVCDSLHENFISSIKFEFFINYVI